MKTVNLVLIALTGSAVGLLAIDVIKKFSIKNGPILGDGSVGDPGLSAQNPLFLGPAPRTKEQGLVSSYDTSRTPVADFLKNQLIDQQIAAEKTKNAAAQAQAKQAAQYLLNKYDILANYDPAAITDESTIAEMKDLAQKLAALGYTTESNYLLKQLQIVDAAQRYRYFAGLSAKMYPFNPKTPAQYLYVPKELAVMTDAGGPLGSPIWVTRGKEMRTLATQLDGYDLSTWANTLRNYASELDRRIGAGATPGAVTSITYPLGNPLGLGI